MSDRECLPNRRVSELVDFEHTVRRWTVKIGRFPPMETVRHELADRLASPLRAALALIAGSTQPERQDD